MYFEFYPKYCFVKDLFTTETLLQRREYKGLYNVFNSRSSNPEGDSNNPYQVNLLKIIVNLMYGTTNWVIPVSILSKNKLNSNNIDVEEFFLTHMCTYCQISKSHKLAFPNSKSKCTKPLELVATDLWGPILIHTNYGYNYYISFIDAHSKHAWIFLLKTKSETHNAVLQFIVNAERQTNCQVKIIQIDGRKEFLPLKEIFQKKVILHRTTCQTHI